MSSEKFNNFNKIKAMTLEEMVEFLTQITNEDSPWIQWFDSTHCAKCDPVIEDDSEFAYCELNDACRFCAKLATDEDIVRFWLNASV